nr:hypothetical protein [uncultured Capnocytophaga sp.]
MNTKIVFFQIAELKSRGMDDKEAKRKATELTMRLRNDAIEYYQKHIKPLEKSSCNSKK